MKKEESRLLDQASTPDELRKLSVDQLPDLCRELRQDIIHELSVNPGHLASSLGVVEITVALHYVYHTPEDRIVWDVGHQAYGHKILTGRRARFGTNRRAEALPLARRERVRLVRLRSCVQLHISRIRHGSGLDPGAAPF